MIGAHHEPRRCFKRRSGRVFEALARFEQRLLAHYASSVHVLGAASCVGDLPGAAQQLNWLRPLIFDLYPVGPDEMALFRLRLVC